MTMHTPRNYTVLLQEAGINRYCISNEREITFYHNNVPYTIELKAALEMAKIHNINPFKEIINMDISLKEHINTNTNISFWLIIPHIRNYYDPTYT